MVNLMANVSIYWLKLQKLMRGMENIKFVNAQQGRQIYHWKDLKKRSYKTTVSYKNN